MKQTKKELKEKSLEKQKQIEKQKKKNQGYHFPQYELDRNNELSLKTTAIKGGKISTYC